MVSVFPATSDGLDANATRRHRNGMAPARPLLPPTHQDANMGERQYATKHAIHPRKPILTMNLDLFSLYRRRRRTRHKTRLRRHHHLQPRWSPARLSPLITRRPSRGCARGEGQDNVYHHVAPSACGGIRRGTDIFKALALGADFCLAGRPAIWGLAVSLP